MISSDTFVGSVSIGLGTFVIFAAVFNWDWYCQLGKVHWIESKWGRRGARVFFAMFGVGLVVLGVCIAVGYLSNSTRSESKGDSRDRSLRPMATQSAVYTITASI